MTILETQTSVHTPKIMEDWTSTFQKLYEEAVTRYESGSRGPDNVVPSEGQGFLASIGMKP